MSIINSHKISLYRDKIMMLNIPARKNAPETKLYVKILTQDNKSLGSRPIIFFLPGGPGADSSPYRAYDCLLDVADIVFHDPRGCGLSDQADPNTYTMDNYIDDIEIIRYQLHIGKIIILGKSYGSMCGLGYALRYPQSVLKLILAAGAPSYRFKETAIKNLKSRGTLAQMNACEKLWNGNFSNNEELAEFFKIMASLYSNRAKTDLQAFKLGQSSATYSYEALNVGFKTFLQSFDLENQLTEIKVDTLILAGSDDWINDISNAKLMAERIPHNKLTIFQGSGHSMETDVPDLFFNEIRNFILK